MSYREASPDVDLAQACLPRKISSRKGENGVVLVVGGSWLYHGAPFLVSIAALRTGVDLVYTAVPDKISTAVRALSPSLIVLPLPDFKLTSKSVDRLYNVLDNVTAAAIGPGLAKGCEKGLLKLVDILVERNIPLVLDATALIPDILMHVSGSRCALTPHAGEFKRLFGIDPGSGLEDRVKNVADVSGRHRVVTLLKGVVDIISNGVETVINRKPPIAAAMTVGGTGDVLTGVVAGFLAKGTTPMSAAVGAAVANGLAGVAAADEKGLHITPEDLLNHLPRVLKKYDRLV